MLFLTHSLWLEKFRFNLRPNCLIYLWNSSIFHRVWDSNSTSSFDDWVKSLVTIYSVLLADTVAQNIFTFLQSGNPLILIIFPEDFSVSFQFKSWTFLYSSTPLVSSTRAITYSFDNSKIFLNYLLIPLIFVLHTQIH